MAVEKGKKVLVTTSRRGVFAGRLVGDVCTLALFAFNPEWSSLDVWSLGGASACL